MTRTMIPRAQRFSIRVRALFRSLGEGEWHEAMTWNLSHTGALVQSETALPMKGSVELKVVLPADSLGRDGATVLCRGEVVRHQQGAAPAVAVNIRDFRFLSRAEEVSS